jgi:hypothetical protein
VSVLDAVEGNATRWHGVQLRPLRADDEARHPLLILDADVVTDHQHRVPHRRQMLTGPVADARTEGRLSAAERDHRPWVRSPWWEDAVRMTPSSANTTGREVVTLADGRTVTLTVEERGDPAELTISARDDAAGLVGLAACALAGHRARQPMTLCVRPGFREVGLGTALVRRLAAEARSRRIVFLVTTHPQRETVIGRVLGRSGLVVGRKRVNHMVTTVVVTAPADLPALVAPPGVAA